MRAFFLKECGREPLISPSFTLNMLKCGGSVESGSQPSPGRARQPRRRPTQVVVGRSARWATSGLATSTSTLSSEACAQQQAYKLLAARTRAHLVHSGDVVCKSWHS